MDKDIIKMQREALETLKYIAKILPEKHIQYALAEGRVALEKQIPKKVVGTYNPYLYPCTFGDCPNCGNSGLNKTVAKYCLKCGQRLDWEAGND